MINIDRIIIGLLGLVMVMAGVAYAGQSSIPVTAGTGTNIAVVTTAAGSNVSMVVACDQAAAASCASVVSNALVVAAAQSGTWTINAITNTVNTSSTGPISIAGTVPVSVTTTVPVSTTGTVPTTVGNTVSVSPTGTTNVICLSGCSAATGTNLTQLGSSNLASATTWGTAPGTSNVLNVNANVLTGSITVSNTNANGQAVMASSSPVAIASDQSVADKCTWQAKTNAAISTSAASAVVVTGVVGQKINVCSLSLITDTAVKVSLIEATSTCASATALLGSTTTTSGLSLAANGGLTYGNGNGTITRSNTASNYLCIIQSGTSLLAGNVTYTQQ